MTSSIPSYQENLSQYPDNYLAINNLKRTEEGIVRIKGDSGQRSSVEDFPIYVRVTAAAQEVIADLVDQNQNSLEIQITANYIEKGQGQAKDAVRITSNFFRRLCTSEGQIQLRENGLLSVAPLHLYEGKEVTQYFINNNNRYYTSIYDENELKSMQERSPSNFEIDRERTLTHFSAELKKSHPAKPFTLLFAETIEAIPEGLFFHIDYEENATNEGWKLTLLQRPSSLLAKKKEQFEKYKKQMQKPAPEMKIYFDRYFSNSQPTPQRKEVASKKPIAPAEEIGHSEKIEKQSQLHKGYTPLPNEVRNRGGWTSFLGLD